MTYIFETNKEKRRVKSEIMSDFFADLEVLINTTINRTDDQELINTPLDEHKDASTVCMVTQDLYLIYKYCFYGYTGIRYRSCVTIQTVLVNKIQILCNHTNSTCK
jgi:hypothetical protein